MIRILLSARLGELRWTQADLARRTGIRPTTINELYHEFAPRIGFDHLDKICSVLQCDVPDILIRVPDDDLHDAICPYCGRLFQDGH